jgi:hypothetical protein
MASPLYKNFSKKLQQNAQQTFRASSFGRLVTAMNRISTTYDGKSSSHGDRKINEIIERYGRGFNIESAAKEIGDTDIARLTTHLERYAKKGGGKKAAVDLLLKELGPIGNLIKSAFGGKKGGSRRQRELSSAMKLLEAFGYTVLPPPTTRGRRRTGKGGATAAGRTRAKKTVGAIARGIDRAREWLSSVGYPIPEEEAPEPKPVAGVSMVSETGEPLRIVELPVKGRGQQFPVDHPIVTGQMIPVSSSNVHSYSYDFAVRILYVRYLQGKGQHKVKGPLYGYSNVMPDLFLEMYKAPSKGKWIWDALRIRGTMSGHKKDYALVGIQGDYVPRKATIEAVAGTTLKREIFHQRTVLTSRGRELTSRLPSTASPNRAKPNNGQR